MARISLVTGANRGIGLEVVKQLATQGDTVILSARDLQKGENAAQGLGLANVVVQQLDMTDECNVQRFVQWLDETYGRLDVLINNAAINYDIYQDVLTADLDSVQKTFEVNTLGAWRVTKALLPLLRRSSQGRIVNVSSSSGELSGLSGTSPPAYSISKLALNGFTLMLAAKVKHERILVNAVCPGWVATEMGGAGGRPIPVGAASVVWAANIPHDGPTGGFFRDGKRVAW